MKSEVDSYDYIVSGAGSAGCAVAARLSESGRWRVLLLEAGPADTNPWIHVPMGYAHTFLNPKVNWKYESVPQKALGGRRLYLPRGKTLGGTSAINGMIYMRGNPADYDGWRQKGCVGWDWDSVLPYFKKAEDQGRGADEFHGVGGPLRVRDQPVQSGLAEAMLTACGEAGIPLNPDLNGASQEGASYLQLNIANGLRWSSATAYLRPARKRKNLIVETGAHATRILIENGRAVGIEYLKGGVRHAAKARAEIIVSGGTYGSPQLLMLSGIGPADHLTDMGIPVVRDLPAVGANLHDHFQVYANWRCAQPVTLNDLHNSWIRKGLAGLQYGFTRGGPIATNGMYVGVFAKSDARLEIPDLQIILYGFSMAKRTQTALITHPFPGFTMLPVHLRPDGRGSVRLAGPDPLAPPSITFGYLQTDYDMEAIIAGIRICREIASQPALRPYTRDELIPGASRQSAADLEGFVRENGTSNSHPTSTCAMGEGPNTVVDSRLRVHGMAGLRVVDASIMPAVTTGNTNAPTVMIAEKAAVMIEEDALNERRVA